MIIIMNRSLSTESTGIKLQLKLNGQWGRDYTQTERQQQQQDEQISVRGIMLHYTTQGTTTIPNNRTEFRL